MRQDQKSWNRGYQDGLEGTLKLFISNTTINPLNLDPLSYASGRVEGEAARRNRPMFGTLQHLTDWIAQQPSDRTFPGAAVSGCLYCQYGNAYGQIASYNEVVKQLKFSDEVRDTIVAEPRTFGAALERARHIS